MEKFMNRKNYFSDTCSKCLEASVIEVDGYLTCTSCGFSDGRQIDWRDDVTHAEEESNSRASTISDTGKSKFFGCAIRMSRALGLPDNYGRASADFVSAAFQTEGRPLSDRKIKALCAAALCGSGAPCDLNRAEKELGLDHSTFKKARRKLRRISTPFNPEEQMKLFETVSEMTRGPADSLRVSEVQVQEVDETKKWALIDVEIRKKVNSMEAVFPKDYDRLDFTNRVMESVRKYDNLLMSKRPSTKIFASIVECWSSPEGPRPAVPWDRIRQLGGVKKTIESALREMKAFSSFSPVSLCPSPASTPVSVL